MCQWRHKSSHGAGYLANGSAFCRAVVKGSPELLIGHPSREAGLRPDRLRPPKDRRGGAYAKDQATRKLTFTAVYTTCKNECLWVMWTIAYHPLSPRVLSLPSGRSSSRTLPVSVRPCRFSEHCFARVQEISTNRLPASSTSAAWPTSCRSIAWLGTKQLIWTSRKNG
jgi:hypothetical protein